MTIHDTLQNFEKEAFRQGIEYSEALRMVRRYLVCGALQRSGGDRHKAAAQLRTSVTTVNTILRESPEIKLSKTVTVSMEPQREATA